MVGGRDKGLNTEFTEVKTRSAESLRGRCGWSYFFSCYLS